MENPTETEPKEKNVVENASDKLREFFEGHSCDMLGLGVSHTELAAMLCDRGIHLTVRDKKSAEQLGAAAEGLIARGVRFVTGEHCFENMTSDIILRSPGIRPDLPGIREAREERGAYLTSETELFLELTEAQTYGITGSDGKTTSTTLTGKFLEAECLRRQSGKTYVGGNIGTPLLPLCDLMSNLDSAVLELSSFQLMSMTHSVRYAAITNLAPNHLDWHLGMEEYKKAKTHILGENTVRFVTNADCADTRQLAIEEVRWGRREVFLFSSTCSDFGSLFAEPRTGCRAFYLRDGAICTSDGKEETKLLEISKIRVPGRHNIENFMTAIALTYQKVDASVYRQVAEEFSGVEHRLEWVRELDGVAYYNSSIDSSPTRTEAALSALHGRDIVVICGGYDKKIPFEPLAKSLCNHVRAVVLTGATGEKIRSVIEAYDGYDPQKLCVVSEPDFYDAIRKARALSRKGGCVLLSPACASFDAFRNFAERGNCFKRAVMEMTPKEN